MVEKHVRGVVHDSRHQVSLDTLWAGQGYDVKTLDSDKLGFISQLHLFPVVLGQDPEPL